MHSWGPHLVDSAPIQKRGGVDTPPRFSGLPSGPGFRRPVTSPAGNARFALLAVAAVLLATAVVGCSSNDSALKASVPENVATEDEAGAPVVVAAGDIAVCYGAGDQATAELLTQIGGTVLTLGDNAYRYGTPAAFADCYDPSWGRAKDRTKPSPGNHDYYSGGAEGYFGYFGEAAGERGRGYYSYDLGAWHVVSLNSNCEFVGGCGAGSAQVRWLEDDLARNRKACTLAYWHHPLFSSGEKHGNTPEVRPLWTTLHAAGAEVVLSGHEHNYERFAPQDPLGKANPARGIRQFVVGTGGRSHYEITDPIANSEVHNDDTYGVLKLTLRPEGYDWRFVPVEGGRFTDSGGARCH